MYDNGVKQTNLSTTTIPGLGPPIRGCSGVGPKYRSSLSLVRDSSSSLLTGGRFSEVVVITGLSGFFLLRIDLDLDLGGFKFSKKCFRFL